MEEKFSYISPDGIVSNRKEEVEYLKECQRLLSAQNFLVGEFDDNGKYSIKEEISKELTNMDKVIDEKEESIYYVTGIVEGLKLKFRVYIEDHGEKKLAVLKLLEEVKLEESYKIETQIATFLDDNDNAFIFRMKDAFRLFNKEDVEGRSMDESAKCPKLSAIIKGHKTNQNILLYGRDQLDKQYIKSVLKILKEVPAASPFVKEFLSLVRKYPKKYPLLRRNLDRIIMQLDSEKKLLEVHIIKINKLRKTYQTIAIKNEEEYNILNKVPEEKKVKKKSAEAKNGKVKGSASKAKEKKASPAKPKNPMIFSSAPKTNKEAEASTQNSTNQASATNQTQTEAKPFSNSFKNMFGEYEVLK